MRNLQKYHIAFAGLVICGLFMYQATPRFDIPKGDHVIEGIQNIISHSKNITLRLTEGRRTLKSLIAKAIYDGDIESENLVKTVTESPTETLEVKYDEPSSPSTSPSSVPKNFLIETNDVEVEISPTPSEDKKPTQTSPEDDVDYFDYEQGGTLSAPSSEVEGDLQTAPHAVWGDHRFRVMQEPPQNTSKPPKAPSEPFGPSRPNRVHWLKGSFNTGSGPTYPQADEFWPVVLPHSNASDLFNYLQESRYDPESLEFLRGRVGVFVERAARVERVCSTHREKGRKTKRGNYIWDQKHNLVYCQIYKSASTTWIYNFLLLGHYRENEPELQGLSRTELDSVRFKEWYNHEFNYRLEAYRLFPPPATSRLLNAAFRQAIRFIIVRHPFARLLSAYRDKIEPLESWPAEFNFRQLGQEIIRVYRPPGENITAPTPTFPEFVQYVIDSTANLTTVRDWKKVVCWTPYWVLCGVCSNDYQLILKLETMHEDEHFLITLANLEEIKDRNEWLHGASGGDSLKKSFKYYRHVTQKQMYLLRERYALDFELFDYNIEEFLEVAKDAPVVG